MVAIQSKKVQYKGGCILIPLSLRMRPEKEKIIEESDSKAGKSKSAFIPEAVDEKLGPVKNRENMIREVACWLSHGEAEELRK